MIQIQITLNIEPNDAVDPSAINKATADLTSIAEYVADALTMQNGMVQSSIDWNAVG